jgi:hypothetical protein
MERQASQLEMEEALKAWLRAAIQKIERDREDARTAKKAHAGPMPMSG